MNVLPKLKRLITKSSLIGVLAAGLFGLAVLTTTSHNASAADCDTNAVVWCGVSSDSAASSAYSDGVAGHNSAKSIQDIFGYFGISQADISTAVAGSVTQGGDVFVNGNSNPVATNAISAGRENITGSTQVSQNGTVFYTRPTSVSFQSASIPALVIMKNGVFQAAILTSCGNPVKATPVAPPKPQVAPKPSYTINKEVITFGRTGYAKSIAVAAGTKVTYRITVKSTGNTPVTHLVVNDTIPAHVTYVPGSFKVNGTTSSAGNAFFTSGYTVASLDGTIVFTFDAIVGQGDTTSTCAAGALTNVTRSHADNSLSGNSSADVSEQCSAEAMPICTGFDAVPGDNRTVKATGFTFVDNGWTFNKAVINWEVGTTGNTTTVNASNQVVGQTHQYKTDGTKTIQVVITFTKNGKTVTTNPSSCQKQVSYTAGKPSQNQPTALVNTGPGSTAGMLAVVTVSAAGAYQWVLRRRLS